jgi:serine/threonine protein kinase
MLRSQPISWDSKMGDGNSGSNRALSGNNSSNKPEWLQQYDLIGKIGEGTYGLVFLARIKSPTTNRGKSIAIKKFKQSKDGDGVSPTAIREIMVLFLLCLLPDNVFLSFTIKLIKNPKKETLGILFLIFSWASWCSYYGRFHMKTLSSL